MIIIVIMIIIAIIILLLLYKLLNSYYARFGIFCWSSHYSKLAAPPWFNRQDRESQQCCPVCYRVNKEREEHYWNVLIVSHGHILKHKSKHPHLCTTLKPRCSACVCSSTPPLVNSTQKEIFYFYRVLISHVGHRCHWLGLTQHRPQADTQKCPQHRKHSILRK